MLDAFTVQEATFTEREETYYRAFDFHKELKRIVYDYDIVADDGRTFRYYAGQHKKSFPRGWRMFISVRANPSHDIEAFYKEREWRELITKQISFAEQRIVKEQEEITRLKNL